MKFFGKMGGGGGGCSGIVADGYLKFDKKPRP